MVFDKQTMFIPEAQDLSIKVVIKVVYNIQRLK